MSKTGKLTFGAVAVLVAVVAIGVFWTLSNLDSIVKSMIEKVGTSVTGTNVSVSSVHISLQEGSGEIRGLTIGNPAGFDSDYALRIGKATVALDKASLTSEVIRMTAITVEDTTVNAEIKATAGINLQKIMDNLESSDGKSDQAASEEGGTKIVIDRFDLTNSELKLITDIKNYDAKMGDVHLKGIGQSSGGATTREVAVQLLRPVIREAIKAARKEGSKHGIDGLKESVTDKLKDKLGIGG